MKKCPFCSEEILDEAIKCKHCGSNLATNSGSNIGLIILAILIPVVGIIVGALKMSKSEPQEKKIGETVLAWSILFMIVWGVGAFFLNQYLITKNIEDARAQAVIETQQRVNEAINGYKQ